MQFNYKCNVDLLTSYFRPAILKAITQLSQSTTTFKNASNSGAENTLYLDDLSVIFHKKIWSDQEVKTVLIDMCKRQQSKRDNRMFGPRNKQNTALSIPELVHNVLQVHFWLYHWYKRGFCLPETNPDEEEDSNPVESYLTRYHSKRDVAIEKQTHYFIETVLYNACNTFRYRTPLFSQKLASSYKEADDYFIERCKAIDQTITDAINNLLLPLINISMQSTYRSCFLLRDAQECINDGLTEQKVELEAVQRLLAGHQTSAERIGADLIQAVQGVTSTLQKQQQQQLSIARQLIVPQQQQQLPPGEREGEQ